jgi:hypothetical protein
MRALLPVLILLAAVACKPRDPDAGGLLSDESTTDTKVQIARGGDWHVACRPTEADGDAAQYDLAVEGAVNAGDEAQELLVSVTKAQGGKAQSLVTKELGHGVVSDAGPLFVGFTSGVLTGDPSTVSGKPVYTGVLTLATDGTEGLKVTCTVARAASPA